MSPSDAPHLSDTTPQARSRAYSESDGPTSDPRQMVAEQRREAAATSTPFVTGGQSRGASVGAAMGAGLGALIASPFAFLAMGDLTLGVRLLIVLAVGAVAGAVAGAVYFGSRNPELIGETLDFDNRPGTGSARRSD